MANGLDIVRIVYANLRSPSDTMLPPNLALSKIREVIRKKKLDLSLVEQNAEAKASEWFYAADADNDISIDDMLLPLRVEARTGENIASIPLVSFNVLNDAPYGSAAFYGNPPRLAFRQAETYADRQIRIIYEPDFSDTVDLGTAVILPDFFTDMVAAEASYLLIMLIPDNAPEFQNFIKMYLPVLEANIADWQAKWRKYVRRFRGQAVIPKRTFFGDRRRRHGFYADDVDNIYKY